VENEIVARERAVDRGIELARRLAAQPALYRLLQKQTLNVNLRRRLREDVPYGQALEGLTAADKPYQAYWVRSSTPRALSSTRDGKIERRWRRERRPAGDFPSRAYCPRP
jgi:hypothetical protein